MDCENVMLIPDLPSGYNYYSTVKSEGTEIVIRVKEITDQSSAESWVNKYSCTSNTIWRKAATYPNSGKINIYKVDLRCAYLTDKRAKGIRTSKNTNCSAKLNILIKRCVRKSRAKAIDALVKDWPALITFKGSHNHVNLGDTVRSSFDGKDTMFFISAAKFPRSDHQADNSESTSDCEGVTQTTDIEDTTTVPEFVAVECNDLTHLKLDVEEEEDLNNFINRITDGLKNDPTVFVPAVKEMLKNTKKFAATETGLIKALHSFGTSAGRSTRGVARRSRCS